MSLQPVRQVEHAIRPLTTSSLRLLMRRDGITRCLRSLEMTMKERGRVADGEDGFEGTLRVVLFVCDGTGGFSWIADHDDRITMIEEKRDLAGRRRALRVARATS